MPSIFRPLPTHGFGNNFGMADIGSLGRGLLMGAGMLGGQAGETAPREPGEGGEFNVDAIGGVSALASALGLATGFPGLGLIGAGIDTVRDKNKAERFDPEYEGNLGKWGGAFVSDLTGGLLGTSHTQRAVREYGERRDLRNSRGDDNRFGAGSQHRNTSPGRRGARDRIRGLNGLQALGGMAGFNNYAGGDLGRGALDQMRSRGRSVIDATGRPPNLPRGSIDRGGDRGGGGGRAGARDNDRSTDARDHQGWR